MTSVSRTPSAQDGDWPPRRPARQAHEAPDRGLRTPPNPRPGPAGRAKPIPGPVPEPAPEPVPGGDADVGANVIDLRAERLAELVAGLTGCEPGGALHAVRHIDAESDDVLEVVARAMVDVDRPPPEGFRVAGFLRDDVPLAEHGSLRRWDRPSAGDERAPGARPDRAPWDGLVDANDLTRPEPPRPAAGGAADGPTTGARASRRPPRRRELPGY